MAECLLEHGFSSSGGAQEDVGLAASGLTNQVSDTDPSNRFLFNDGVFMTFGDGSNRYTTFPGLITAAGLRQYSYPGKSSGTLSNRSYTYPVFTSKSKLTPYQLTVTAGNIVRSPIGTVFKDGFSTAHTGIAVQFTGNGSDTIEHCLFFQADAGSDYSVGDSGKALLTGGYYAFAAVLDDDKIYFHIPFVIGAGKTGKTDPKVQLGFANIASTYLQFRWRDQGSSTKKNAINMTDEGTYDVQATEYGDRERFLGVASGFDTPSVDSFGVSVTYHLPSPTGVWAVGEVIPYNLSNPIHLVWTDAEYWENRLYRTWTIVQSNAAASYGTPSPSGGITIDTAIGLTLAAESGKSLTSSSYAYAYVADPIDLTDRTFLSIELTKDLIGNIWSQEGEYVFSGAASIRYTASEARIGFCKNPPVTSKNVGSNFAKSITFSSGDNQVISAKRTLDVSTLTGDYYLTLYVKSKSSSGAYVGNLMIGNVMLY